MFGPLNSHHCIGNIVISKIVISARVPSHTFYFNFCWDNIHRCIGNIVILRVVISGFHCIEQMSVALQALYLGIHS